MENLLSLWTTRSTKKLNETRGQTFPSLSKFSYCIELMIRIVCNFIWSCKRDVTIVRDCMFLSNRSSPLLRAFLFCSPRPNQTIFSQRHQSVNHSSHSIIFYFHPHTLLSTPVWSRWLALTNSSNHFSPSPSPLIFVSFFKFFFWSFSSISFSYCTWSHVNQFLTQARRQEIPLVQSGLDLPIDQ